MSRVSRPGRVAERLREPGEGRQRVDLKAAAGAGHSDWCDSAMPLTGRLHLGQRR